MCLYKPELQATAKDLDEVKALTKAGADAIVLGNQQFGNRVCGDFTLDQVKSATDWLHLEGKRIYIMVNAIFHNDHLKQLPDYLKTLETFGVDGIIAGDQAIFQLLDELNLTLPLTWNPATLSTNYQTLNFWHQRGLKRATLSNELSLDAVIEIKQKVAFPIEIQVHGMTCIFQSKRKLIRNYYNHIKEDYNPEQMRFIKEDKKDDTHYPIFEDGNGTHIMSNEDLVMIEYLDQILEAEIDGLLINGILKTKSYNEKIVSIYREAIDTYLNNPRHYQIKKSGWRQAIEDIQPEQRAMNTGFYFKEQIY
ncbi:peptidase U32 family protein [Amphibacillus jilinensis]|uniref:peptidase U32 family protein n=1 Tax=Amphibacillus jilinensis TaxID=1216008 RepID=UPI000317D5F2|nr:peptidase U32 family protein [Amphibacillus jilinensis]